MPSKDQGHRAIEDVRFNGLLLEAVGNTFDRFVGRKARNLIYVFLKAVVSLKKENISRDLAAFDTSLKKIFGFGALAVEKGIVKELYSKIGLKDSVDDNFMNPVKKAKTYFALCKKEEASNGS